MRNGKCVLGTPQEIKEIQNAYEAYEFEFIHPFADGNGRMWHTLLLSQWNELFAWPPIEGLIRERQQEYYDAFAVADRKADCTGFVEMVIPDKPNSDLMF